MKRLVLIMILIIQIPFFVFAQSRIYRGTFGLPEQNSYIELILGDTDYTLELCVDFDDVYMSFLLSFGRQFNDDDNTLVLCDRLNGFYMLLRAEGEKGFILEKGFSNMAPMRLTYYRDNAGLPSLPQISFDSVRDQWKRYRSQTELRDFRYGLYEIVHPCVFQLEVSEDTTYRYFVNEIVVSEGVWKRRGNLIVFHDSSLGEAFSALVEDGYLVGSCIPGEFGSGKFRIIPKEEYDDIPFLLTPNKDYNPKTIHDCPQN